MAQYIVLIPNRGTKFFFPGRVVLRLDLEKIVSASRQNQGLIILHFPYTYLFHALTMIDLSTHECVTCKRVSCLTVKKLALKLGESVDNNVKWITYLKGERMASINNKYVWSGQEIYFPTLKYTPYDEYCNNRAMHKPQGKYRHYIIRKNDDDTVSVPGAKNDREQALANAKNTDGLIIVNIGRCVIVFNCKYGGCCFFDTRGNELSKIMHEKKLDHWITLVDYIDNKGVTDFPTTSDCV